MARPLGGRWETDLELLKVEGVAAWNWGLVNGKTLLIRGQVHLFYNTLAT
jgi:hypothetical protein